MQVTRIRLCGYRSYTELTLVPSPGLNVIVGPNAAGKTNILEAVFLSALGRSHRTKRDAELINSASRSGYVCIDLTSRTGSHRIEFKLREGEHKQVLVDGQRLRRMGELMGVINVVMFSPEDLSLVKDSAQERRRFMDMELCQLRPAYFYGLQQYNAALKQRGALIKAGVPVPPSPELLEPWDERLAALGGDIMAVRRDFMDDLSTIAHDLHRRITGGRERLFAFYKPNVAIEDVIPRADGMPRADVMPCANGTPYGRSAERLALLEALHSSYETDLRRGYTTRGPHRDDIGLLLDVRQNGANGGSGAFGSSGFDVRVFGSQGQQRTAALSLKLSEIALMRREKSEPPVLLLDDVLSELDADRQRELLSSAFDCQCFLTATSLDGLEGVPNMTVFECSNGGVERVKM